MATGLSGDIKLAPRGQRLLTPEHQGVRRLSCTVRAHASMTPARKPPPLKGLRAVEGVCDRAAHCPETLGQAASHLTLWVTGTPSCVQDGRRPSYGRDAGTWGLNA